MDELTISAHAVLEQALIDRCYALYHTAFTPLQSNAAARHLLTAAEFSAEMTDRRIDKFIAWRGDDLAGLATFTNDLSAIPWIEPQFYLSRWPDKAARGALFYLGYALADPRHSGARVFTTLIDTALRRCVDVDGTICWDACAYNAKRAVGRINERVVQRWGGDLHVVDTHEYSVVTFDEQTREPRVDVLDTQTYYVAHFDRVRPAAAAR